MDLRETHELLILASAIDHRTVDDGIVSVWQQILADTQYKPALQALTDHRRNSPGVYLEPGHIVQGIRQARERHREMHGIHPAPPPGKRWAVDVIESMPLDPIEP